MKKQECQRCKNFFYTATGENNMHCPYCGFSSGVEYEDRRSIRRKAVRYSCDILKGEVRVPVKLMDISDTGVGIRMKGYLPFEEDDTVRIIINELNMEKSARIVWARKVYGISKAGLKFC